MVSNELSIEQNFQEDLKKILLSRLQGMGYLLATTDFQLSFMEVVRRFFRVKHLQVTPLPRKVIWSRELLEQSLSEEQRAAIQCIQEFSEEGKDLTICCGMIGDSLIFI